MENLNFNAAFHVAIEKMSKQRAVKKSFQIPKFDIQFIDFSQRRKEGFRGKPEFDNKRILIANETSIKVFAY